MKLNVYLLYNPEQRKNQPVQAKNGKEKYVQIRRKLQFRASGYSKFQRGISYLAILCLVAASMRML
jgi:hypothetical protein